MKGGSLMEWMLSFRKFICRFASKGVFSLRLSQRLDFRYPLLTLSASSSVYLFGLASQKLKQINHAPFRIFGHATCCLGLG